MLSRTGSTLTSPTISTVKKISSSFLNRQLQLQPLLRSHPTLQSSLALTLPRFFHSSTSTLNSNTVSNDVWDNLKKSLGKPSLSSTSSSSPTTLTSSTSPISSPSPFQHQISYVQEADRVFKARVTLGNLTPNDPTSGRQVMVHRNDVEKAYRQMSNILKRNNMRYELKLGERYEKPNQMRRRKRSERHRRRFRDMVRSKVQLVMALKARGA